MKPREKNYFAKAYKQEGWQHEWEQLAKNHISFIPIFMNLIRAAKAH